MDERMQRVIRIDQKSSSARNLFNFPDFSKEFHIYKDASDYQLGAVIMKDGKQLAF